MEKVLVSACLAGVPVRYDGTAAGAGHPVLARWLREGRAVLFCPEAAAGLPVPRPPAELVGDRVRTVRGEDVTEAFEAGARQALALCLEHGIRVAVLQERSPSCGSSLRYDGTFSGVLVPGEGLTTALLRAGGITVFPGEGWAEADRLLDRLEALRHRRDPER